MSGVVFFIACWCSAEGCGVIPSWLCCHRRCHCHCCYIRAAAHRRCYLLAASHPEHIASTSSQPSWLSSPSSELRFLPMVSFHSADHPHSDLYSALAAFCLQHVHECKCSSRNSKAGSLIGIETNAPVWLLHVRSREARILSPLCVCLR